MHTAVGMTASRTLHQVWDLKLLEKLAAEQGVPFIQQAAAA
jgi:hypothetical protein